MDRILYRIDMVAQVAICILGFSAVVLVAKKNKWGFVAGLASQVPWYFTTTYHHQWPLFVLNIGFTCAWAKGIYEWFFKAQPDDTPNLQAGDTILLKYEPILSTGTMTIERNGAELPGFVGRMVSISRASGAQVFAQILADLFKLKVQQISSNETSSIFVLVPKPQ
jgi:hypothetical protein